jgi:hypothetical protein
MSTRNILGIFLGVKGSQHVALTTLPPSMSRLSRKYGNLNIHNPMGLHKATRWTSMEMEFNPLGYCIIITVQFLCGWGTKRKTNVMPKGN